MHTFELNPKFLDTNETGIRPSSSTSERGRPVKVRGDILFAASSFAKEFRREDEDPAEVGRESESSAEVERGDEDPAGCNALSDFSVGYKLRRMELLQKVKRAILM